MRLVLAALAGAALAGAVVVPPPSGLQRPLAPPHSSSPDDDDAAWPDALPVKDSLVSALGDAAHRLAGAVDDAVGAAQDAGRRLSDKLADAVARNGRDGRHRTIYELIRSCEHTARFAKLVDQHPSVVKLLNGTHAKHTLFVPTNEAFDDMPDDGKKPDKALVESLLKYHVGLGEHPAVRLLTTHTLPTAFDESFLGDEPQRLRASIGLSGVTVNFYSKEASNGIIHAVNKLLVPPPMAGIVLTHFPSKFSTLLLAYDKTDFVKYIHKVKMVGSTLFVPSNDAFERLGVRANHFLFNTDAGHKCLEALLKYQISPNATFYTDAFYDKRDSSYAQGLDQEHYDLPTLLGDARIGVDVMRLGGFSAIRVNGFAHISVRDGLAKNGVIQVVDQVLIPPRNHKNGETPDGTSDIDVEELKARLAPYV